MSLLGLNTGSIPYYQTGILPSDPVQGRQILSFIINNFGTKISETIPTGNNSYLGFSYFTGSSVYNDCFMGIMCSKSSGASTGFLTLGLARSGSFFNIGSASAQQVVLPNTTASLDLWYSSNQYGFYLIYRAPESNPTVYRSQGAEMPFMLHVPEGCRRIALTTGSVQTGSNIVIGIDRDPTINTGTYGTWTIGQRLDILDPTNGRKEIAHIVAFDSGSVTLDTLISGSYSSGSILAYDAACYIVSNYGVTSQTLFDPVLLSNNLNITEEPFVYFNEGAVDPDTHGFYVGSNLMYTHTGNPTWFRGVSRFRTLWSNDGIYPSQTFMYSGDNVRRFILFIIGGGTVAEGLLGSGSGL